MTDILSALRGLRYPPADEAADAYADACENAIEEIVRLRAKLTLVMELLAEEKVPMTSSVRSVCVREIREALGLPVNEEGTRNG